MDRIPVQSSNIAQIGYDAQSEILEVEFTNGNVYEYKNVPAHVHEALMTAPSHGNYLNSQIKPNYPYQQIG